MYMLKNAKNQQLLIRSLNTKVLKLGIPLFVVWSFFKKNWRMVISSFDRSMIYIICRSAVFAKWWSHLVTLDYVKKITAMCSLKWPWAQFSEVRSFRFVSLPYYIASMTKSKKNILLFIFFWCQDLLYNRLANVSVLEVSAYLFAGISLFESLFLHCNPRRGFVYRALNKIFIAITIKLIVPFCKYMHYLYLVSFLA